MIDLSNKVTLITGGSRGIGAACVKLFSAAGSVIAFTYNNSAEEAEKLTELSSGKNKIRAYKCDAASEKQIKSCVDKVLKEFGRIDILINNAGIWNYGAADEMSLKHWNETINVNLNSMFLFTKYVLPGMKLHKSGKIINVSSTAGQRGEAFHSHYAASKGGMISYTKSLAAELAGFNINVNSVAPGWVWTDMSIPVFDKKYKKKVESEIPIGRIASAEDIAGPCLFLASELARHINGEILNVNGGSVLVG